MLSLYWGVRKTGEACHDYDMRKAKCPSSSINTLPLGHIVKSLVKNIISYCSGGGANIGRGKHIFM